MLRLILCRKPAILLRHEREGTMLTDEAHIRLILVRHTMTDDDVSGRYSGQNDVMLNGAGLVQAERLAETIERRFPIHRILSSDLLRAKIVARLISLKTRAPIHCTSALREVHLGALAGSSKDEFNRRIVSAHHRPNFDRYDYRDVGGEEADQVADRCATDIDQHAFELVKSHPDIIPTLLIVSHPLAIQTLFVNRLRAFKVLHLQGEFQECEWIIARQKA